MTVVMRLFSKIIFEGNVVVFDFQYSNKKQERIYSWVWADILISTTRSFESKNINDLS